MSVIRKEAFFTSCNGKNRIRALIWQNDECAPKGVVQIAHGEAEHIGRYDEFAGFLAENGYVVCGNDHIGHGKSADALSELGKCASDDHVTMLRDMNTLHRIMKKRVGDIPYFVFGYSMGSLLARIYSAAFSSELSGAVFCGTAHFPSEIIAFEDVADGLFSVIPDSVLKFDVFGKITKTLLKEDDDLSWLSRSPECIEAYRADPLCGAKSSAELRSVIVKLAVRACSDRSISSLPADFPVLIISGAKDPMGFFGKGVMDFADALAHAGLSPEVFLYPGDRHDIMHEDDREKVYRDIKAFLNSAVCR